MTSGKDVQLDQGGFTRIHNLILDKLAETDLGKSEFRCVMFLLRMTYGYQCKAREISQVEWVVGTKLDPGALRRALRNLVAWRVLNKTAGNGRGHKSMYGFNKYFEQWEIGTNSVASVPVSDQENSVASVPVSGDKQGQNSPINRDKTAPSTTSPKERKKVGERKETAAAAKPLTENLFVAAYEQTWGRLVESRYIGEKIADWQTRITIDGWRYALEESAKANARNWNYLTRILDRIERDGFSAPGQPQSLPVIDFTVEELYGHR